MSPFNIFFFVNCDIIFIASTMQSPKAWIFSTEPLSYLFFSHSHQKIWSCEQWRCLRWCPKSMWHLFLVYTPTITCIGRKANQIDSSRFDFRLVPSRDTIQLNYRIHFELETLDATSYRSKDPEDQKNKEQRSYSRTRRKYACIKNYYWGICRIKIHQISKFYSSTTVANRRSYILFGYVSHSQERIRVVSIRKVGTAPLLNTSSFSISQPVYLKLKCTEISSVSDRYITSNIPQLPFWVQRQPAIMLVPKSLVSLRYERSYGERVGFRRARKQIQT